MRLAPPSCCVACDQPLAAAPRFAEPIRICTPPHVTADTPALPAPAPGRAGPALNLLLLSFLYALYCFDYKWSLHGVQLQQRLAYFERHWAFFLGGLLLHACHAFSLLCGGTVALGTANAAQAFLSSAGGAPPAWPPPCRVWRRHGAAHGVCVILRGRRPGWGALPAVDHDGLRLQPQAGVPARWAAQVVWEGAWQAQGVAFWGEPANSCPVTAWSAYLLCASINNALSLLTSICRASLCSAWRGSSSWWWPAPAPGLSERLLGHQPPAGKHEPRAAPAAPPAGPHATAPAASS